MAEITKSKAEGSRAVPNYIWILLAILIVAAYFSGLTMPLVGPDEPRYAQVAREMWQNGDWITPTLGGFNWFEKPALLYWLEIAAYSIFGVSEFSARLGPALFGLGTVAALWLLGRAIGKEIANWFALVAASTLAIVVFAHGASFDIIVTFPMTAALVSFFLYEHKDQPPATADGSDRVASSLPLLLFYFFVGVSLLAKGLIGIVFPFAIVGLYFVFSRRLPTRKFIISLFWGTLLAVAVASVWYLPAYLKHGWEFVDEFIVQHHFQRFTSNKYQHPQPFYFFLWVLPLMTLPWMPFFFAALWRYVKEFFQRKDAKTQSEETSLTLSPSRPLALFALSWLFVPLVFFSLSGSKLPGYILPAVPGAVILTTLYIVRLTAESRKWGVTVMSIAAFVLVGCTVLTFTIAPRFANAESVKGLIAAARDRGFGNERVFGFHTVSHNAEFYAAGRLLREPGGKQKKLYSSDEIVSEMQRAGARTALVIVPLEYQQQLAENKWLRSEFISENGEVAIYAVAID